MHKFKMQAMKKMLHSSMVLSEGTRCRSLTGAKEFLARIMPGWGAVSESHLKLSLSKG